MDTLNLVRRGANVDTHVANAHALLALDAFLAFVAVLHDQRVAIAEHPLKVSVGTKCGAKTLAQKKEVEQYEQRSDGSRKAARCLNIERNQPMKQVTRLDEVGDKHKGKNGGGHP